MKKPIQIVAGISALIAVFLAGVFFKSDPRVARVYGEEITSEILSSPRGGVRELAGIVEERLTKDLIEAFEIPTDEKAVATFIRKEAPSVISDEKTHSDQQTMGVLAEALQSVVDGNESPESAYEAFNLIGLIDEATWFNLATYDANEVTIQTMRQFSSADVASIQAEAVKSMRPLYIERTIKEKICMLPDQKAAIEARLTADDYEDGANGLVPDAGRLNYECAREVNKFVELQLDEHVIVDDPELIEYRQHIQILNRSVESAGDV